MDWFAKLSKEVVTNGVISVGLAGALDKGLKSDYYTIVPKEVKVKVELKGLIQVENKNYVLTVNGAPDNTQVLDATNERVMVHSTNQGKAYEVKGAFYSTCNVQELNQVSARLILAANKKWIDDAQKEMAFSAQQRALLECIILCQINYGLLDADEDAEWKQINTDTNDPGELKEHMEIEKCYDAAMLLISAAVLNHYKLNHTTGQGGVQGFLKKIVNTIDFFERLPTNDPIARVAALRKQEDFLYLALHRIGKRNGCFALLEPNISVYAARAPGMPLIPAMRKDDFVSLRAAGAPAGAGKIAVISTALKMASNSGLLCFMPEVARIDEFIAVAKLVKNAPLYCHSGARWFQKFNSFEVKQNFTQSTELITLYLKCACIYVHHIAKHSSLADSPAFTNLYDGAAAELSAWDNTCSSYATARKKTVDSNEITQLISMTVGSSTISNIQKSFDLLKDLTKAIEHPKAKSDIMELNKDLVRGL
jgi:hypothetical protein